MLPPRMNDPGFRYYLITDRKQCSPRPLTEVVRRACRNGIRAVQLREKDLPGKKLLELATELRRITFRWNAKLFINDRADIALATGADGVHCRETSMSPADIKKLSASLLVGSSVHSLNSAKQAQQEGADFLLFGPVCYTSTKAKYGDPQGTNQLKQVVASVNIPVLAVGGITPEHARSCLSAGAWGVAGISSIMSADSVEQQVRNWKNTLGEL